MHPGRRSCRVKSHAPRLHAHGDVTDARRADIDEMGVDRLAFHMLGILGDLMRAAAKHRVGLRRTVAGQNVDWLSRTRLAVDLPNDVEEVRIHFCRLVEPPVAHEPVQLVEDRGIVNAIDHVGERAGLVGMPVGKDDGAGVAVGDRRFGGVWRQPGPGQHRRHRQPRSRAAAPAQAPQCNRYRQQTVLPKPGARRAAPDLSARHVRAKRIRLDRLFAGSLPCETPGAFPKRALFRRLLCDPVVT